MTEKDGSNQIDATAREYQEAIREIAKEIVARRIVLKYHIGLYILANFITTLIYFLSSETDNWYLWVIIPWGLAIIIHVVNFYLFRHGLLGNVNEYLYVYHVVLFIIVNILLIFINGFTSSPRWQLDWYWIVLISWGGAFLLHSVAYFIIKKRSHSEEM